MGRVETRTLLTALALFLPISLAAYLAVGPITISPIRIIDSIGSLFAGGTPDDAQVQRDAMILSVIRLPRALMAILVGACLACSGAAMQGLFRNPLADPSLIGVSSGASAGASFVIVFGAVWVDGSELVGISLHFISNQGLNLAPLSRLISPLIVIVLLSSLLKRPKRINI